MRWFVVDTEWYGHVFSPLSRLRRQLSQRESQVSFAISLADTLAGAAKGRLTVNLYHGGEDSKVFGRYENGRIDVNIDRVDKGGKSMVMYTLSHELTHYIKEASGAKYRTFAEVLTDHIMDEEGKTLERLIREKKARDSGISDEEAMDEIVADGCELMLENTEIFNKLAKKDKSLAQQVADYIKGMLKRLYEGITKQHYESKVAQKYIAELQELWDNALEDALTGEESVDKVDEKLTNEKQDYSKGSKAQNNTMYSIAKPFTDANGTRFDNAVLLDTDFFDGISPRKWGEQLRTEVNKRASANPFILPIADENGNTILLQFARPDDRVTKDGYSNHKVLDKLSSSTDNVSKLAVIHIDEIVSVSEENSPYYTNENNHQWLDEKGWLHRNANVINQKNGNIYNLTVDIAKTADGRTILYATDGKIKKLEASK